MNALKIADLKKVYTLLILLSFISCKKDKKVPLPIPEATEAVNITYAQGFSIDKSDSGPDIDYRDIALAGCREGVYLCAGRK